ncbi:hypothetical protein [Anaerosporobacter faecicola]|uniref:hypothetical protein n=1 Tax=Anaerosporobacter faecicola TaxID=2718714 RepID=UPI00143AB821|nr:hypothetical protein [Anaerosporobacter faecicola]
MNPFEEKGVKIADTFKDWSRIQPKPYCKQEVDPYTKTRIILMNGTEFEQVWFGHQFSRSCPSQDLRKELALIRRSEQQQQKVIGALKPPDETILEHTVSYEQLAVDLTAELAQREPDLHVKMALDFALLEDFDHLYRYSDLLEMEMGAKAEQLVGHYTEIMPGRPTIAEHRYPYDNLRRWIDSKTASPITKLNVEIITAAEQQTMNYYMNVASLYESDLGRSLYQEIGLIEEQHVTQYGGLLDTNMTMLEKLLCHEYTECYLYYSCFEDEKDERIKAIWEEHFIQEVGHLHLAADLLKQYDKKEWQQVIPDGNFPQLLKLRENKQYVRDVLANTVKLTSKGDNYVEAATLPQNDDFFQFQEKVNANVEAVPSHQVIAQYIEKNGMDYRFEESPNPVPELQDRKVDNTTVGREML